MVKGRSRGDLPQKMHRHHQETTEQRSRRNGGSSQMKRRAVRTGFQEQARRDPPRRRGLPYRCVLLFVEELKPPGAHYPGRRRSRESLFWLLPGLLSAEERHEPPPGVENRSTLVGLGWEAEGLMPLNYQKVKEQNDSEGQPHPVRRWVRWLLSPS
jgi:hypothetical protein